MVDPTTLAVDTITPAPSVEQAHISTPFFDNGPFVSTFVPLFTALRSSLLTYAMIYHIGSHARSTNARAARIEIEISKLIDQAIKNALAPLIERVVKCEGPLRVIM